ncbi:MAG: hypothetical protein HQM10_11665 [Candidatus Riflebacteria bacterium]|nr:hypothetical protein [Candidatus Riflebacteria bacterium]
MKKIILVLLFVLVSFTVAYSQDEEASSPNSIPTAFPSWMDKVEFQSSSENELFQPLTPVDPETEKTQKDNKKSGNGKISGISFIKNRINQIKNLKNLETTTEKEEKTEEKTPNNEKDTPVQTLPDIFSNQVVSDGTVDNINKLISMLTAGKIGNLLPTKGKNTNLNQENNGIPKRFYRPTPMKSIYLEMKDNENAEE